MLRAPIERSNLVHPCVMPYMYKYQSNTMPYMYKYGTMLAGYAAVQSLRIRLTFLHSMSAWRTTARLPEQMTSRRKLPAPSVVTPPPRRRMVQSSPCRLVTVRPERGMSSEKMASSNTWYRSRDLVALSRSASSACRRVRPYLS